MIYKHDSAASNTVFESGVDLVPVGDIVYANEESSGSLPCQLYGDEESRSRSMIDQILVIHCTCPR
jgi:hypothetical protein